MRLDTRGRQFSKKLRDAVQAYLMSKKEGGLSIGRAARKLGFPRSTLHEAIQSSKKLYLEDQDQVDPKHSLKEKSVR